MAHHARLFDNHGQLFTHSIGAHLINQPLPCLLVRVCHHRVDRRHGVEGFA